MRLSIARLPKAILGLLALCFLLTACAETQLIAHAAKQVQRAPDTAPAVSGAYKIGKPYKVAGNWYYPTENYEYDETGIASWYGPGFHGRRTANGERYDMDALTAAHPTLPMPSVVRVTNLDNGRSIVLRINDRGPFARSRIIDVSRQAARSLGFQGIGTAKVRVTVLADESRQIKVAALNSPAGQADQIQVAAAPRARVTVEPLPGSGAIATGRPGAQQSALAAIRTPVAAPVLPTGVEVGPVIESNIFIQAGAFGDFSNALRMRDRIGSFGATNISRARVAGGPIYRVRVGPVASVRDADILIGQMIRAGVGDATLVVE